MASGRSKTQVTPPTPGSAKTHWSLPMKKYLLPVGAGVVVFGVVTAFAASLTVNGTSLAAGNATITACNSSATATYSTALATSGANQGKYVVNGGTLTTDGASPSNCKGLNYKVTLLDGSNVSLGTASGQLADPTGDATLTFATSPLASAVGGVAVVIT